MGDAYTEKSSYMNGDSASYLKNMRVNESEELTTDGSVLGDESRISRVNNIPNNAPV